MEICPYELMKVLEVHNLTKIYPSKKKPFIAVDHVSFSLEKGEIVGFLGPNGAGKTTTINMLLGALTPTSGEITYLGRRFYMQGHFIDAEHDLLKQVGFASAYVDLPWRMTVWENLSFYSEIYEVQNKRERIKYLLTEFESANLINKKMSDLSSGQKTRILLIKAFLNSPKIVLLDEPTASLDVEIAVQVRSFIKKQQKEFGTAVLLTSHNMRDIEEMANRVLVINRGKLVDEGTPLTLVRKIKQAKLRFYVFEAPQLANEVINDLNLHAYVGGVSGNERWEVEINDEMIPKLLAKLFERKVYIRDLEVVRPTLEDYFYEQ